MNAYYNENDPKAAAWLRELIKADLIAPGGVDERSIEDVTVGDLRGFTQHHFFAGIGGWSYALRLAGWPDDRPVWTGSCPCQPFSAAGKRKGTADERHLWPAWHWLIKQYRPNFIFGEQVGSKDGITWLDIVSTDLEGEGYTFAPIVFPACGVGAPHLRSRAWIVADSESKRLDRRKNPSESTRGGITENRRDLGDSAGAGPFSSAPAGVHCGEKSAGSWNEKPQRRGPTNGYWSDVEWIECRDGKARPIKPGIFPLAHGLSGRVGLLRGAGNAIVPQVAKEIIESYMETHFANRGSWDE